MKLVISIDVEEEGLFTGRYPSTAAGVRNVQELRRLDFVHGEFGLPLTLLATHAVAADAAAAAVLADRAARHGAEIGAHLHPWNTPPLEPAAGGLPSKLDELLATIRRTTGAAVRSFRMGRFEFESALLELLPPRGLVADSSIVPLRFTGREPILHFLAGSDPFPIGPDLTEVPITMVPLTPALPRLAASIASRLPGPARRGLLTGFRYVAAAGIHPAWFSLATMRHAARRHRDRGGNVLHLFLHSSDLMAGGSPAAPTIAATDRLVWKIRTFLAWLRTEMTVEGTTMSRLTTTARSDTSPACA